MSVIVCGGNGFTWRAVHHCHWCERRRRFLVTDELWYGSVSECGGCGHRWSEEGRERQTNTARAYRRHGFVTRWDEAHTRAEYRAWLHRQIEAMNA